jgi:glycosyltransferase involved in cell wall biosynthesis
MAKLKIIQMIDSLEQGGAQKLIYDLMFFLKNDFDFYVLSFSGGPYEKKFKDLGLPVSVLGIHSEKVGFKYPCNVIKAKAWLEDNYQKIKPDIIQAHGIGADIWARWVAPKDVKIIQTVHLAEAFRGNLLNLKGLKHYFFDHLFYKKTQKIVAVSEAVKKAIVKEGFDSKAIQVIHTAIETKKYFFNPEFKEKFRSEFKIDDQTVVLGSVGRLEWVKGFDVLIKAFALINKEIPNTELFIVGEGAERKKLEALIAQFNLQNKVHLLGLRQDVAQILNLFDIFVSSSRWEGLPLVILEAMANHKPIIATDAGGTPEVIKNNLTGVMIKQENSKLLAGKINFLIKNPKQAQKLADNAFAAATDFDISKMAAKYKKIYLSL